MNDGVHAVAWTEGALTLLDQRRLPGETVHLRIEDVDGAIGAIRDMVVRAASTAP